MIWRNAIVGAVFALSACGVAPTVESTAPPTAPAHEVVVTEVTDGDTIRVTSSDGTETKVRALGIDSPETKDPRKPVQCWGPEASQYATTVLLNRMVVLVYVELADGPNAGQDFSTLAAAQGAARSYIYDQRHPPQRIGEIQAAERDAVQARRGLWGADCLTRPTR
jgi:micrococcal nuclease